MRNVSDKILQKIKTHILCSIRFFENRAVYEKMWKNFVEWGRPQITIWRMHNACWITKATYTDSEYVMLTAFPLQQWLQERDLMLRYRYRVSQEECARLGEGVPYVKVYRHNRKHLCPKLNGYGDNGQRKVWSSGGSTHCTCQLTA